MSIVSIMLLQQVFIIFKDEWYDKTIQQSHYNIQYSYDPEVIIIGGGISVREDMIDEINKRLDIIIDKVEPARIKPVVKKCAFANDANIIGAIYHYLTISKQ